MIVDRRVFVVKKGHMDDALAVAKEVGELLSKTFGGATYRIYRPTVAPSASLSWEGEWESLAEWEKAQTVLSSLPEYAALGERWNQVSETSDTHEMWTLVE